MGIRVYVSGDLEVNGFDQGMWSGIARPGNSGI